METTEIKHTHKSPRPVMRAATWLNVSYGMLEAYIGGSTGSSAALANGVHNFADGVSHAAHTATHIEEHKADVIQHKVQAKRRIAAGAIALGACLTGAHAAHAIIYPEAGPLNTQALAVELGAVAINGGLLLAIRRRKDETLAYQDAMRHHAVDGAIATMTAASIAITPSFVYADGLGGMVATAASGYLAYKTYENKN